MGKKYQGKAYIRFDGAEYPTGDDSSLDVGGNTRGTVKGARVYGFQEEAKEATMECKIYNCDEIDLMVLKDMTDATVEFETDVGQTFLLSGAWASDTPTLNHKGEISMKVAAVECKRV